MTTSPVCVCKKPRLLRNLIVPKCGFCGGIIVETPEKKEERASLAETIANSDEKKLLDKNMNTILDNQELSSNIPLQIEEPRVEEWEREFDAYFSWNRDLRCLYVPSWGDAADVEDVKDFIRSLLLSEREKGYKETMVIEGNAYMHGKRDERSRLKGVVEFMRDKQTYETNIFQFGQSRYNAALDDIIKAI